MKNYENLLQHRIASALAILLFTSLILSGCKKDETDETVNLIKKATIQLSGSQEVPAVSTSGTGTAEISYDPSMKMITYKIIWQLGSASATTTNMHFHGSDTGSDTVSSGVALAITGFSTGSSGTLSRMSIALRCPGGTATGR